MSTDKKQIDGDHYVKMGIQPWEVIERAGLDYWEGAAVKYILRWKTKDGLIDIDKAIHYLEHIKARAARGCYGPMFTKKENMMTFRTHRTWRVFCPRHKKFYERIAINTPKNGVVLCDPCAVKQKQEQYAKRLLEKRRIHANI